MDLSFFPPLNASLNALAASFLTIGFVLIRQGRQRGHIAFMIAALVSSAVFLACYLTYHFLKQGVVTEFPKAYPTARVVYLTILISHSILAVINLPMVIITVVLAARKRLDRHVKWARWTLPIWFYVSVTGVLVYFMLYQWFLPPPEEKEKDGTASAASVQVDETTPRAGTESATLAIEPPVATLRAKAEDETITARFTVRNDSERVVRIVHLDTNCSCLSVKSDKPEMAAGEVARIEAVFELAKVAGESEKYVILRTDHPEMREARLRVMVEIEPVYKIEPRHVQWKVGAPLESKTVRIRVVQDDPIEILKVQSSRQSVAATLEVIDEGREYEVLLEPSSTDKILLGMVRVATDHHLEKHRSEIIYYSIDREESP